MTRWIALASTLLAGCATVDYASPEGRLVDITAYTLPAGDVKVGLGLTGTTYDNAGASADLRVGLPAGFEVGTNAIHDALSFVNLDVKWNFLDTRWIGLAARIGGKWLNPQNLYVLPDDLRSELGDLHLIMVPVALVMSFPFSSAFGAHLTAGYNHSNIVGRVAPDNTALADGLLGAREVYLTPQFTFYPSGKAALILGAQLPVYTAAVTNASAETEIEPGVVVGVRSAGYTELDTTGRNTLYLAVEAASGAARVRFTLIYGLRLLTERLGFPVPALDVYWRF